MTLAMCFDEQIPQHDYMITWLHDYKKINNSTPDSFIYLVHIAAILHIIQLKWIQTKTKNVNKARTRAEWTVI
jgi:sigma54-dependent transcription regulator